MKSIFRVGITAILITVPVTIVVNEINHYFFGYNEYTTIITSPLVVGITLYLFKDKLIKNGEE